jgi:hypothetical protein
MRRRLKKEWRQPAVVRRENTIQQENQPIPRMPPHHDRLPLILLQPPSPPLRQQQRCRWAFLKPAPMN